MFLSILSALTLLGSIQLGAMTVTRSSLLGYDIADVGAGLSLVDAAIKLETLTTRVTTAVESARRSLRVSYLLAVDIEVTYGIDGNGYNAATVKVSFPNGERGTWQEGQALSMVVYCLRENLLGAASTGRLQATARLLGDEGLAALDEREEELAGQRDDRW